MTLICENPFFFSILSNFFSNANCYEVEYEKKEYITIHRWMKISNFESNYTSHLHAFSQSYSFMQFLEKNNECFTLHYGYTHHIYTHINVRVMDRKEIHVMEHMMKKEYRYKEKCEMSVKKNQDSLRKTFCIK